MHKIIFTGNLKRIFTLVFAVTFPISNFACTIFTLNHNDGRYISRSFDWDYADGVVLVNPRGATKTSLLFDDSLTPATWVSKYGSVTLNQAADEFPMSGMNEAGLTVDVLVLAKSKFPRQFSKPVMNEVQIIQYLLDTSSTVAEAKTQAEKVQVSPFAEKVHWMVCDANSDCAAFEYLNGALVVSKYAPENKQILANDLYSETLDPRKMSQRPKAAYDHLQIPLGDRNPIAYMMEGLQKTKLPSTVWQLVYSVHNRQISFRDFAANNSLKTIDLKKMDFTCGKIKSYIDIKNSAEGEISNRLAPYPESRNIELLKQVLPDAALVPYVNQYYQQISCATIAAH